MIYIFATLIFWISFRFLVPLREWNKYYPSLIFSALLGLTSDLLGVVYNQWEYRGLTLGGVSLWAVLGIAPPVGALFIRLFPRGKSGFVQIFYWIFWAAINAIFEQLFVWFGWVNYLQWNSLKAFLFYLCFFGLVWGQEYWYNGSGKIRV